VCSSDLRYALPDVIRRFAQRFPRVQLSLRQGTPAEVSYLVASGHADISIATEPLEPPAGVVMLPCYELQRIVLTPKGHPLLKVKTLKTSVDGDAKERANRLRTEAVITSRIRSSRVVRPLDVGVTDTGTPYLVQDYVDGLDLAELDASRRRALGVGLPLWYVCEVVAEIASGLAAAHRTGVLHRDLKPSNLFVSPEEGVQLGDFGVAVARGAKDGQPLELAGTLEFMAPETLRAGVFHRRTDVYGLGATAFQLRYGRPPFTTMRDVVDDAVAPAFPRPETPEEAYFQQAVTHMLERTPERRWSDMVGQAGRGVKRRERREQRRGHDAAPVHDQALTRHPATPPPRGAPARPRRPRTS
jgi:serine/threonine protein kinase